MYYKAAALVKGGGLFSASIEKEGLVRYTE